MTLAVQNKPDSSPSLSSTDAEIKALADEIWGDLDGDQLTERTYGKGRVLWVKSVDEIPDRLQIMPDFGFLAGNKDASIRYIHKRVGDLHMYFVANAAAP